MSTYMKRPITPRRIALVLSALAVGASAGSEITSL